jgi:hypothetical protein
MSCLRDVELEALASAKAVPAAKVSPEAQAHAASCPKCTEKLRERRAVRSLLAAIEPVDPSELEWRRIDKHVLEAMSRPRPSPWRIQLPWAIGGLTAAAAAALLAVSVGKSSTPVAPPKPPEVAVGVPRPVPVPAPERAHVDALVLAGRAPLAAAQRVPEGTHLQVAEAELLLQTAPATGVQLSPHADAYAVRLRDGETEWDLESGELRADVKPLTAGQSFRVRAGDVRVTVVGTAFTVARDAKGMVTVAVSHGRVKVERENVPGEVFVATGQEVRLAATEAAQGHALEAAPADLNTHFPLGIPDEAVDAVQQAYRLATIDSVPTGALATLDGAERGPTPVQALASVGAHEVTLSLPGHAARKQKLQVGPTGGQARMALRADVPPESVTPRLAAHETPKEEPRAETFQEAFHQAAVSHQTEVQECFAKDAPDYSRRVHLVINLQANGAIAPPVSVEEPGLDQSFLDCVTRHARAWKFPAPGRAYEVSVPYDVQATR